eukprot:g7335.t1
MTTPLRVSIAPPGNGGSSTDSLDSGTSSRDVFEVLGKDLEYLIRLEHTLRARILQEQGRQQTLAKKVRKAQVALEAPYKAANDGGTTKLPSALPSQSHGQGQTAGTGTAAATGALPATAAGGRPHRSLWRRTKATVDARLRRADREPLSHGRVQRKLRVSENRLQQLVMRVNELKAENGRARHAVQAVRKRRLQQLQMLRRAEKALDAKELELDMAQTECQSLEDEAARVKARQEALLKDFKHKLGAFFNEKGERERELEQAEAELRTEESQGKLSRAGAVRDAARGALGGMSDAQEQRLREGSNKAYWTVAKKVVDLQRQAARAAQCEDEWQQIEVGTGAGSVDALVAAFERAEEENFGLFGLINTLNHEIEQLEAADAGVEAQLKKFEVRPAVEGAESGARGGGGGGGAAVGGEAGGASDKRQQTAAAQEAAASLERGIEQRLCIIERMREPITNIFGHFERMGSIDEAGAQLFAATGLSEHNLLQVLGLFEEKLAQYAQVAGATATTAGVAGAGVVGAGAGVDGAGAGAGVGADAGAGATGALGAPSAGVPSAGAGLVSSTLAQPRAELSKVGTDAVEQWWRSGAGADTGTDAGSGSHAAVEPDDVAALYAQISRVVQRAPVAGGVSAAGVPPPLTLPASGADLHSGEAVPLTA